MTKAPILTLMEGERIKWGSLADRWQGHGTAFPENGTKWTELIGRFSIPKRAIELASMPAESSDDEDDKEPTDKDRYITEVIGDGTIRVGNLVGSVTLVTDSGDRLQLEILPKLFDENASIDARRSSLKRMWLFANDLSHHEDRQQVNADRQDNQTLHEWLLERFLDDLRDLVARGMRGAYITTEDNLVTLRGRLLVGPNIRRNAFAAHRLWCSFDIFSIDRPENRLIRTAIDRVITGTETVKTRQRALGLRELLREIPLSSNIRADFAAWRTDRSMLHYTEIRQTCDWLLNRAIATPIAGGHRMFGRLVRMNDVFERYVGGWLAERAAPRFTVDHSRRNGEWLISSTSVRHQMVPDVRVSDARRNIVAVLDMKWKKSASNSKPVPREDLYQFFAYGTHFLRQDDSLLAGVYPTVNRNERVLKFQFRELPNVSCFRLPFLLPIRNGDHWIEGFVADGEVREVLVKVGLEGALAGPPVQAPPATAYG